MKTTDIILSIVSITSVVITLWWMYSKGREVDYKVYKEDDFADVNKGNNTFIDASYHTSSTDEDLEEIDGEIQYKNWIKHESNTKQ